MVHDCIYTRGDVLRLGFEARCVGVEGARCLWHGDRGLRVDERTGTTLISDPAVLPEGPWIATAWSEEELREGETLPRPGSRRGGHTARYCRWRLTAHRVSR